MAVVDLDLWHVMEASKLNPSWNLTERVISCLCKKVEFTQILPLFEKRSTVEDTEGNSLVQMLLNSGKTQDIAQQSLTDSAAQEHMRVHSHTLRNSLSHSQHLKTKR